MPNKPTLARARPKEIKVTERYRLQARILGRSDVQFDGDPQGEVKVTVPYDGQKYFTQEAVRDVRRLVSGLALLGSGPPREARIGFLTFTDHRRTNLDDVLQLSRRNNVFPLQVPIYGGRLTGVDSLQDARSAALLSQEYRPPTLVDVPLRIEVAITDEDELRERQATLMTLDRYEELAQSERDLRTVAEVRKDWLDAISSRVARQEKFAQSLMLFFRFTIRLPEYVRPLAEDQLPELSFMVLDWPVDTSYRFVHLYEEDAEGQKDVRPLFYNAEGTQLEWGGIKFRPLSDEHKEGGAVYRSPSLALHADQPGELYNMRWLKAKVKIKVPLLYSGVRVGYFDATGRPGALAPTSPDAKEKQSKPGQVLLKQETVLEASLKLHLESCFRRRLFSPYQHLQFPSVVLEEMRLSDVIMVLRAQRFDNLRVRPLGDFVRSDEEFGRRFRPAPAIHLKNGKVVSLPSRLEEKVPPDVGDYLLTATRQEGSGLLWLWIRVEGTRLHTRRRRTIAGGETYLTPRRTGDMTLYLRAELEGDSSRAVQALNEIHRLLKQRFALVRVIK